MIRPQNIQNFNKRIPFREKLRYIFKPPGWSHDGSTLTVKQQQKLHKEHQEQYPDLVYNRPN